MLPPLLDTFLDILLSKTFDAPLLKSLATTFDILCKVRGPKVVLRYFENEARYVEPMLKALLSISRSADLALIHNDDEGATIEPPNAVPVENAWQLRYILLLWLSHLMLTPFDLSSVGSVEDLPQDHLIIALPKELPSIAQAAMHLGLHYISAPTKEQTSAAKLLVNLATRPDIRRLGTFHSLVALILSHLSTTASSDVDMYSFNGYLKLLHVLLRSTNSDDIAVHLPPIFNSLQPLFGNNSIEGPILLSSSVSKKLAIKIQREIVICLLQIGPKSTREARQISAQMLQDMAVLEDVVDNLLSSLSDQDTQVRLAASKALAVITAKLDTGMAHDIVDAVIAVLGENVRQVSSAEGKHKDLSAVNPLRWHGLTMTLAHMLFRRSAAAEQLKNILDALYLSLAFEQRSTSGSSIGINVRDAANFGLWSLARRYTTKELVPATNTRELPQAEALPSKIQATATNMLVTACLDSAGNVRRGSAAALQELIGRHPDMVEEGIAIIQTVDYHAVGLRRRAMIDVAYEAAQLCPRLYRAALWDGLLSWRGLQAPDTLSRNHAAIALGRLSGTLEFFDLSSKLNKLVDIAHCLQKREVEWRHGVVQAISDIIDTTVDDSGIVGHDLSLDTELARPIDVAPLWKMFESALAVSNKDLYSASMRPDLITSATIRLIGVLCKHLLQSKQILVTSSNLTPSLSSPTIEVINTLDTCLKTADQLTLDVIPTAIGHFALTLTREDRMIRCKSWLRSLDLTKTTPRRSGYMISLASLAYVDRFVPDTFAYTEAQGDADTLWEKVSAKISEMFWQSQSIEIRVTCLQCLAVMYTGPESRRTTRITGTQAEVTIDDALAEVLETSLKDYTINERGDVGSLLRLEAMDVLSRLLTPHDRADRGVTPLPHIFNVAIHRLALERLDKVRMEATRLLRMLCGKDATAAVSTISHFRETMLDLLSTPAEHESESTTEDPATAFAFWRGISSSAGAGSETLMQIARSALFTGLDELPLYPDHANPQLFTLQTMLTHLLTVLSTSLTDERVLLPLLETLSFLLDAGIFGRQADPVSQIQGDGRVQTPFKFLTLLSLVQKSHFKSTSLPKLLICVQIYCGLALLSEPASGTSIDGPLPPDAQALQSLRLETLKKLVGMLLHTYAKVRIAAAEALFVTVKPEAQELMKGIDWGENGAEARKVAVRKMKRFLGLG